MTALNTSANAKLKINAAAIVCGLLLILSGCSIPKLRPAAAGPALPDSFNGEADGENSSYIPPGAFFNDPMLAGLFDQALAQNQQLRILAENIRIANNEVLRRRGTYLPMATIGTSASLNKYSYNTLEGADNLENAPLNAPNFPTPLPNFLAAADITWQIDIWRQLRNSRDAAALRFLGTRDGWNYVVTRLLADVAVNYYQLMALDKQLETLDRTITLQEQSLEIAKARKAAARDTELAVQRFQAEVRKNQSQKLIISQQVIETENQINFLCGRYPQPVQRVSEGFLDLTLQRLNLGVPSQLLMNRPDVRQAERELAAAGLDVRVARANFFPKLIMSAGVGWEAFNPKYLFLTPESLIYSAAGGLVAPLVNKKAIQADYMNANAMQLQALYNYQRTILNAYTEVINQISKVRNYSNSIELKRQQVQSLETAVAVASNLFQNARVEYLDVLISQRDRNEALMILFDTKSQQLAAVVNAYQALGGGQYRFPDPPRSEIGRKPPTRWLPVLRHRPPVEPLPIAGGAYLVPEIQPLPPDQALPVEPIPTPQPTNP